MASIQDKLLRGTATLRRKYYDIEIAHIGTEQKVIHISMVRDKYGDTEFTVVSDKVITGYIDYPGNEIPIAQEHSDNTANRGLYLYELLPIEGYFQFEDKVKFKDIILQKISMGDDDDFRIMGLQVSEITTKADVSAVWRKYILSPWTLSLESYPNIQTLVNTWYDIPWE